MQAEIRSFDIKKLPYTVRFGLGSIEPVKRWARFELRKSEDLYWTCAQDVRKDVDSSWIHITVHQSGEIHSSRYTGKGEEQKKVYQSEATDIGSTLKDITTPHQVVSGNELFEPGYLCYGLPTLTEKDKKTDSQNRFVACLDVLLVNSRLHYFLDLVPWISEDEIIAYLTTERNQFFAENDQRCHAFIFGWERVSIIVAMKFTDGDNPIDLQKVAEADKNAKPLKRLFHHVTLSFSESVSLRATPRGAYENKMPYYRLPTVLVICRFEPSQSPKLPRQ